MAMSYVFAFEKLDVWKLAKDFAVEIYSITKKFPSNKRFGMVSQVNRAVMSVVSNIA